jgi:hypothetical protein
VLQGRIPPRLLHALIASFVIAVFASPLLHSPAGFWRAFGDDLWLGTVRASEITHGLNASYFVSAPYLGVFSPYYAFYGGPLFTIYGLLINLFGSVIVAFIVLTVVGIISAYGGMYWLSRICGVNRALAHIPAIVVLSSAYWITVLYARQDWPEFMAVAAIPTMIAAGTELVRRRHWNVWIVAAFMASVIIFTGSHTLSLLWGTLVLLGTGFLLAAIWPRFRCAPRRLVAVAALGVAAAAINAWALLPDVVYGRTTNIGNWATTRTGMALFFDSPRILFDVLRVQPSQSLTANLYVQVPMWFLAWAVIVGIVIVSERRFTDLRRGFAALCLALLVLLALIISGVPAEDLPAPFSDIQFPYRLNSYVALVVAAMVVVALLAYQKMATTDRNRRMTIIHGCLFVAAAVSILLAGWQIGITRLDDIENFTGHESYGVHKVNAVWDNVDDFTDASTRYVAVAPSRKITLNPYDVDAAGNHLSEVVAAPAGLAPILTNVSGGPGLVSISGGVVRIGRGNEGFAVVRRLRPGTGPVHVVVQTAPTTAVRAGSALTLAGIVAACLALVGTGGMQLWRRSRRRSPTDAPEAKPGRDENDESLSEAAPAPQGQESFS